MTELTSQQQQAITSIDRPVALLAAAGSGKTTVLVERYLELLKKTADASSILTVTFTVEAAEQMRQRILKALDGRSWATTKLIEQVTTSSRISTLHGLCYWVVNTYGSYLDLPSVQRILDPLDFTARFDFHFKKWIRKLDNETIEYWIGYYSQHELKRLARQLFESRHQLISSEKESGPSVDQLRQLFKPLFIFLGKELRAEGLYRFDDLEHYCLRILNECDAVRSRLQEQFRYLLVDEFQDTSLIQWNILSRIFGDNWNKLFVVGDPKQSIYRFRNADASIFETVAADVLNHNGETQHLDTNFRSGSGLIDSVNEIGMELFDKPQPMVAARESNTKLQLVHYGPAANRQELSQLEMEMALEMVKDLIASGHSPDSITLLFRMADRIPAYYDLFDQNGIAVACKRTVSLFESWDVVDLIAYLKFINNPLDDLALASFLRSSFVGWTHAQLQRYHSKPMLNELIESKSITWLTDLVQSGTTDPSQVLQVLFRNSKHWPNRGELYRHLFESIGVEHTHLSEFVERLQVWQQGGVPMAHHSRNQPGPCVRLMTVHASKGLEFDHVLLVDNVRQLPTQYPMVLTDMRTTTGAVKFRVNGEFYTPESYEKLVEFEKEQSIEESKRILYVALTRARDSLYCFVPREQKGLPKQSWATWLQPSDSPSETTH